MNQFQTLCAERFLRGQCSLARRHTRARMCVCESLLRAPFEMGAHYASGSLGSRCSNAAHLLFSCVPLINQLLRSNRRRTLLQVTVIPQPWKR